MLGKKVAIFTLLVLVPLSGALAGPTKAKWVKIRSASGRTMYIDTGSIIVRGNLRDVWEKTVENVNKPERVAVEITRWRFDCAKRRNTMLYSESYLKNGTFVGGAGIPESQRIWDGVLPTSESEVMLKFVCLR